MSRLSLVSSWRVKVIVLPSSFTWVSVKYSFGVMVPSLVSPSVLLQLGRPLTSLLSAQ